MSYHFYDKWVFRFEFILRNIDIGFDFMNEKVRNLEYQSLFEIFHFDQLVFKDASKQFL